MGIEAGQPEGPPLLGHFRRHKGGAGTLSPVCRSLRRDAQPLEAARCLASVRM